LHLDGVFARAGAFAPLGHYFLGVPLLPLKNSLGNFLAFKQEWL
jgi:hypothetical protein